jgi:hypothetical protein
VQRIDGPIPGLREEIEFVTDVYFAEMERAE